MFAFCRAEDSRPGLQEVDGDHEARMGSPGGSGQAFGVHLTVHQTGPEHFAGSEGLFDEDEFGEQGVA